MNIFAKVYRPQSVSLNHNTTYQSKTPNH